MVSSHLSASTVNQTSKQQAWLSLRVFSTIVSQSQQILPSLAPALRWMEMGDICDAKLNRLFIIKYYSLLETFNPNFS